MIFINFQAHFFVWLIGFLSYFISTNIYQRAPVKSIRLLAQASKQMKQLRPICMLVLSNVMHLGMFVGSVNTTVQIPYSNVLTQHLLLCKHVLFEKSKNCQRTEAAFTVRRSWSCIFIGASFFTSLCELCLKYKIWPQTASSNPLNGYALNSDSPSHIRAVYTEQRTKPHFQLEMYLSLLTRLLQLEDILGDGC